ncbi:MAG: hypothetical protein ABW321_17400 [Polyangiales bacterium]
MTELGSSHLVTELERPLQRELTRDAEELLEEHDALTRELLTPLQREEVMPLCQGERAVKPSKRQKV